MSIIEKIQKLPDHEKKILLWTVVVVLSLLLLFFWVKKAQYQVHNFKVEEIKEGLNMPNLEMPQFNIPEINEQKQ